MNFSNHTLGALQSKIASGYYRRYYVSLFNGTWMRVSKPDLDRYLSYSNRSDTLYGVAYEHEKNIGNVLYIAPLKESDL